MKSQQRQRNSKILWGLILLAAAFDVTVYFHPSLTGIDNLNGILGVWLGLFISAWPAANFLNMILYEDALEKWRALLRSDGYWVLLNLIVSLVGLSGVIIGTKLFFRNW